jgi:acyl phosphate:glycerol-3-phosphate acyltransferase
MLNWSRVRRRSRRASGGRVAPRCAAAALAGYLLGSLPSGVLVGRAFGADPRQHGSKRTGATNVLRTLGPGPAALVALLDISKGAAAVLFARALWSRGLPRLVPSAEALAGSAALLGHNFSVFIRFTGGRGVLTTVGATAVMSPIAWLSGLIATAVPIALTRYVSLGSITGAAASPVADLVLVLRGRDSLPHLLFLTLAGGFVIYAHRDNIARLLNGTERRLGQRSH